MNKSELIKAVAAKVEVPQVLAAEILDAAIELGAEAIKKGEGLQLVGYVNASIVEKAARKAKNPRTGEVVEVPARKVVKLRPGTKLAL